MAINISMVHIVKTMMDLTLTKMLDPSLLLQNKHAYSSIGV